MKCSFKLRFNPSEIINLTEVSKYSLNTYQIFYFQEKEKEKYSNIFNEKFLSLLKNQAPIDSILIFNKPRLWRSNAHTDPGLHYGLNIIPFGSIIPSYMQWFDIKENVQKNPKWTAAGTPFYEFNDDEIKLIDEENTDNSVIMVRTDLPHKIKVGEKPRVCISIRFEKSFNSWDDVKKYYSDLGWVDNS
jgi:hypothetical protein